MSRKIIFELVEVKETPRGKARLDISFHFEPVGIMREEGHIKDLAERIMDTIYVYLKENNGSIDLIAPIKKTT